MTSLLRPGNATRRRAVRQRRVDGVVQTYHHAVGPTPLPVVPPKPYRAPLSISAPYTRPTGFRPWPPDGELRCSLGYDVYGYSRAGKNRFTGLTFDGTRLEISALALPPRPFPKHKYGVPSSTVLRLLPAKQQREALRRAKAFDELVREGILVRRGQGWIHVAHTGQAGLDLAVKLLDERVARDRRQSAWWRQLWEASQGAPGCSS